MAGLPQGQEMISEKSYLRSGKSQGILILSQGKLAF